MALGYANAIDGRRPLRSVLRLLARRPGWLTIALTAGIVKETALWSLPFITATIVDIVSERGDPQAVLWWAAVAVVLLVQNYPNHLLWTRAFSTVVRDTGAALRSTLTERLQQLSIGYHSRASASLIQSKVVRDVENVEVMLQQAAHPLVSATMVLLGATTLTAITVPQFLPVYALAIPIALLLRYAVLRHSRDRNEQFRHDMERFAGRVGEMAALIPITRAHGLERTAIHRVVEGADDVRRSGLRLDMLNGLVATTSWVSMQLLGVCCLVLAAVLSLTDVLPITPGEVVLLASYFALLTQGLTALLMLMPIISRGVESVRSIAEVLDEPDIERNEGKQVVATVEGRIRFEDVCFRYPGAQRDALHGVSLSIDAGETVAFVGSSGSGKSTLINLVLGFLRPCEGRVLLDGADLQELDLRAVRRFISVVPQESTLFEGTIRDNVSFGMPAASDDDITSALSAANALDVVATQPAGWNTRVGERGARLSGGQRQRIAIARALIRNPRILVLDEATSALDPESERSVRGAFERLRGGRTTLVVAHRLSTVTSADRIVVLEHGQIVEEGTFTDLMHAGGRFAVLHGQQLGEAPAQSTSTSPDLS